MKTLLSVIVLSMLAIFYPIPAQATGEEFAVKVLKRTSCDQRAPRIEVVLTRYAQRVGYGYPNSDTIYWLDTDGVAAGTYRYTLQRQPFGSTRQWVPVAAFKGDQGLYTAPMLTFKRPAKANCVVKRNPRVTNYSSDVNVRCGANFEKMMIVRLKVKRVSPGYIVAPGVAKLVKKSGIVLRSTPENTSFVGGAGGTRRMVEYYFFVSRGAQFKLDPSANGIWPVVASSKNVELVASLDAMCQYMGT